MINQVTLQNLAVKLGLHESIIAVENDRHYGKPLLESTIYVDESLKGIDAVIDGRKRLMRLLFLAKQKMIPWEFKITVSWMNSKKLAQQKPTAFEIPGLNTSVINPEYIRNFLILNQEQTSEKDLTTNELADLVRQIYRFLRNSLRSNHTRPYESMELVSKLNIYLNQANIAEILNRSEGWVSEVLSVSKLPAYMIEAGRNGLFSFSNAVVIARAESAKEKEILFELAKNLDYRTLVAVQRYLSTHPDLADKINVVENIKKIFQPKIMDIEKNVRLRLEVGVQRSLRKFLRSRMQLLYNPGKFKPGKDPQSLVFRLKIVLDGENALDLTEISPQDIENFRKTILNALKSLQLG